MKVNINKEISVYTKNNTSTKVLTYIATFLILIPAVFIAMIIKSSEPATAIAILIIGIVVSIGINLVARICDLLFKIYKEMLSSNEE